MPQKVKIKAILKSARTIETVWKANPESGAIRASERKSRKRKKKVARASNSASE